MQNSDKKMVLLTGASGGLGREVLAILVQRGYKVRVFDVESKKSKKLFKKYGSKIDVYFGDLSNSSDLNAICKGVDFVIHLAAIIPPLANDNPKLATAVNVDGTKYLLDRILQEAPDAFVLFASSLAVYGDRLSDPYILVGDPLTLSDGDHYGKTKLLSEELVRESNINWCVFRFSAMLSYIDFTMSPTKFDIPLDTKMEFVSLENAALACCNALDNTAKLRNRIFNLGGGEAFRMTYRQFLTRFYGVFGLGDVDYPNKAFAEQNFSCGFLNDSNVLNDILNFQQTSADGYFERVSSTVSPVQKWITKLFKALIKKQLLKKSKPYKAYQTKDQAAMKQYFIED